MTNIGISPPSQHLYTIWLNHTILRLGLPFDISNLNGINHLIDNPVPSTISYTFFTSPWQLNVYPISLHNFCRTNDRWTKCRSNTLVYHSRPSADGCSTQKNPDDVVITLAIRTPLCKSKRGGLKDTPLDGLVLKILQQVRQRSHIDPALVEDVCLGNVSRNSNSIHHHVPKC